MSVYSKISQKLDFWTREIRFIPKHVRYAISSVLAGLLMSLAVTVSFEYIFFTLPIFMLLVYWLVWFAIYENIDRVEWAMLFVLPVLWALEWYVFFYMIPVRWLTRVAFSLVFGGMFYVLVSVENIYNVGVEKNIQLQKAATTVSTIFLVGLSYIAFQVIASFELYFFITAIIIGVVSWIFAIKFFWTADPKLHIDKWQISMSNLTSICMFFVSIILTFIPFSSETTRPVVLAGVFYMLTNLFSESRDVILFRLKRREFIIVFIAIVVIMLATLQK
ncbi:MAG: hypothetical protein U0525_06200 [Patescibacteria group bacterium]